MVAQQPLESGIATQLTPSSPSVCGYRSAPCVNAASNEDRRDIGCGVRWTQQSTATAIDHVSRFLTSARSGEDDIFRYLTGTTPSREELLLPGQVGYQELCKLFSSINTINSNKSNIGPEQPGSTTLTQLSTTPQSRLKTKQQKKRTMSKSKEETVHQRDGVENGLQFHRIRGGVYLWYTQLQQK